MKLFLNWAKRFYPEPTSIGYIERTRASLGAVIGIFLTSVVTYWYYGDVQTLPFLIAPMGASAVLLFAVPSSTLAQPWSILGGNITSALVGITCVLWINNVALAAALAVGFSIFAMHGLKCLHPPGGAVALTAVLSAPLVASHGYAFALVPVGLNSAILLLVALIFNYASGRTYPHKGVSALPNTPQKTIPAELRFGFTMDDINAALKAHNAVLDVSRDDLQTLLQQTEMHAYRRRFGEIICADIMTQHVVSVEFGTELEEAWALMRSHGIKALPVIDRAKRVIGMISQVDFMHHANLDIYATFETKLKRFIQRTASHYSDKPEVVGQIMTTPAVTARFDMHITELIPLMTREVVHQHIPIVDAERRLIGMVTQSDLVSAIYHGRIAQLKTIGLSS